MALTPDGDTPEPAQPAPEVEQVAETPSNVVELHTSDVPRDTPPETSEREEPWEDRYRHLEGKYRAEVPRLHAELRELRAEIDLLRQKAAPPAPAAPEQEPERFVTDQDVDAFGEDLIDLQRRVAREVGREFRAELTKLQQENQALREQVGVVQFGSFETRLRQAIPDFDQVNQSREWIEWLNAYDPLLQGPRRVVAEAAYNRNDVDAVKAYVDLFKQTLVPAQRPDRQAELKRQIQPAKATAGATPNAQTKLYTSAEAAAVFNRIQRLTMQGDIDAAAALEAEISTAYVEGRVSG